MITRRRRPTPVILTVRDRKWRVDPRQMWFGFQSVRSVKILEESSQTGSVSLRPPNSSLQEISILSIVSINKSSFFKSWKLKKALVFCRILSSLHCSSDARSVKYQFFLIRRQRKCSHLKASCSLWIIPLRFESVIKQKHKTFFCFQLLKMWGINI